MVTIKRERFIVFQIFSDGTQSIPLSQLRYFIWTKFQLLYGLEGTTGSGLYFVEYDETNKIGLVRCSHNVLEDILTSMAMISKINDNSVIIVPVFISGLLNKAKKHYRSILEKIQDKMLTTREQDR